MAQTKRPDQIFVVDDSGHRQTSDLLRTLDQSLIVIPGPRKGVSAARNAGIRAADDADFIALLDDDDYWLPHKIDVSLQTIRQLPNTVVSSRSLVVGDQRRARIRPDGAWLADDNPVRQLYEGASWLSSRFYIPTPSLVFPREVSAVVFDETLTVREDMWWLWKVSQSGFSFIQLPDVLQVIDTRYSRGLSRDSWILQRDWINRLGHISRRSQANFLLKFALKAQIAGAAARLTDAVRPAHENLEVIE